VTVRRAAPDARGVALTALARVEAGAYANVALPAILRRSPLDVSGRAWVTDAVYGTVRWQRRLDHHLAAASSRPLDALQPVVRAGLRLGMWQVLVGGVPAHAAVDTTVEAVGRGAPQARGFVNAVLRRAIRSIDTTDEADPGVRWSLPDWIVERFLADLGPEDGPAALALVNEPPTVTLRPNPRRPFVAGDPVGTPGRLVPGAIAVRGGGDPAAWPVVADGRATPQDEASQAVVAALDPQPGERILDLAAAPGGKATAMAERMDDTGLVVALDVRPGRLGLVGRATRRLGLDHVAAVCARGPQLPLRDGVFDRVLLDAPCSGLGTLRRRPEARWRITEEAVDGLAALQRALLGAAAAAVRPGGVVAYSVCTFTREETLAVDEWAADALADLEPLPPPGPPWRPHGRGALLPPAAAATDGMYCLIVRRAPVPS
jgi:16S rRNA (cytosine967-C5)-methyltransferase